jgi:hypothetical protein
MFGVRNDSNVLEVIYLKDHFTFKFYDVYKPRINPIQKVFLKKIYMDSLNYYLRNLDEIIMTMGNYEKIKEVGKALYQLIIPKELDALISNIDSSLNIQTECQNIPWELLHDNDNFWGIKYKMGRSILLDSDAKSIRQEHFSDKRALIISNPSNDLEYAGLEAQDILRTFRNNGVKCRFVGKTSTPNDIFDAFESNHFDFIHYSGHVVKDKDEYKFLLDKGKMFSINMIKDLNIGKPLVYLNGCISGKIDSEGAHGFIQNKIQGAVLPFISAGAVGVIGSLWKVSDNGSSEFSQKFYKMLIDGCSIGESIIESRKYLLEETEEDPVWASFVYYGHPGLYYNFGGSCYIPKDMVIDPRIESNLRINKKIKWEYYEDNVIDILNQASKEAELSKTVTSVHIMKSFEHLYPILYRDICQKFNLDSLKLKTRLINSLKEHEEKMKKDTEDLISLSYNLSLLFEKLAESSKNISVERFISGILEIQRTSISELMKSSEKNYSKAVSEKTTKKKKLKNNQDNFANNEIMNNLLTDSFLKSLSYANYYSGIRKISTTDLFVGIFKNNDSLIGNILKKANIDCEKLDKYIDEKYEYKFLFNIQYLNSNDLKKNLFSTNTLEIVQKEMREAWRNKRKVCEIEIFRMMMTNYCSITNLFYKNNYDMKNIIRVLNIYNKNIKNK